MSYIYLLQVLIGSLDCVVCDWLDDYIFFGFTTLNRKLLSQQQQREEPEFVLFVKKVTLDGEKMKLNSRVESNKYNTLAA